MKILILLSVLVSVAFCAKQKIDPYAIFSNDPDLKIVDNDDNKPPTSFTGNVQQAKITSLENNNAGRGRFKYAFETQNGISIAQVGKLKDEKTFVVSGSYSYTGADGRRYKVKYTADERGYHPITELEDGDVTITQLPQQPKAPNLANNFNNKLNSNGNGQNTNAPKPFSTPQLPNGQSYLPPTYQAQKPLPNPRGYLPPKGYLPPQRY